MKTAILFLLLFFGRWAASRGGELPVRFHKNVEVLGLAYLIGFHGPELEADAGKKDLYPIAWRHFTEYRRFAQSPNLRASLGVADHLWLDYLIAFLLQVGEFPHARLTSEIPESTYLRFSLKNDKEEARVQAGLFLEGLNAFYREMDFERYWKKEAPVYEAAVREVKAHFPGDAIVSSIETFYRKKQGSYLLVPSLTLPAGMGFGIGREVKGKMTVVNVFGPVSRQYADSQGFSDSQRIRDLTIHEFSHPFANPGIDAQQPADIAETEKHYESIRDVMTSQGYITWKACLYEYFVRAGEVVIARQSGREEDARRLLDYHTHERKFADLPVVVDVLSRYARTSAMSYTDAVKQVLDRWK